jgi:hypothetical protein
MMLMGQWAKVRSSRSISPGRADELRKEVSKLQSH